MQRMIYNLRYFDVSGLFADSKAFGFILFQLKLKLVVLRRQLRVLNGYELMRDI